MKIGIFDNTDLSKEIKSIVRKGIHNLTICEKIKKLLENHFDKDVKIQITHKNIINEKIINVFAVAIYDGENLLLEMFENSF